MRCGCLESVFLEASHLHLELLLIVLVELDAVILGAFEE